MTRYVIGVDVGGTFTDIFVLDRESGAVTTTKTPSTLDDQSRGFVAGIGSLVEDFGDIATVLHGTTTGTNALLERKGAKTGIITTTGFRDVLEMRRRDRPTTWGLWGQYEPVVPRDLRLEVDERVLADGTVHTPVDLDAVRAQARVLLEAGCTAVCVFFINGYANDANERAAVAAVREIWPTPYVTAATEILPEIREFERLSTATLNAYLQPLVSSYMDRLERGLEEQTRNGSAPDPIRGLSQQGESSGEAPHRVRGRNSSLLIVQSNGGVMSVGTAKAQPVRTALSGPAAGVIAAKAIAGTAGFPNIVTCDMGGTSFDVSLVAEGEAALAAQTSVDFGMVIRAPMIEITTIGAGGGSIASVDASGLLRVGPESAGSNPGPVCYGQGNERPTVTDANLVLGRINPDRPIGGALERLDIEAAKAAIMASVGEPLGLGPMEAAEAILKVANALMAGAIRLVSIERGHDPSDFAAMPFGGGGSLHTGALMLETGLGASIVPRFPGVTSALGCVVADMRHDRTQTVNAPLAATDAGALGEAMRATAADLHGLLGEAGVAFEGVETVYELDMLYTGQTHAVAVPLTMPEGGLTEADIAGAFDAAYRAKYGRLLENVPKRVMNTRVAALGRRPQFDMRAFAPVDGKPLAECRIGTRALWAEGAMVDAPVYDRMGIAVGERVPGPCLLEQADTTIYVDPGLVGVVDEYGNLVIRRGEG